MGSHSTVAGAGLSLGILIGAGMGMFIGSIWSVEAHHIDDATKGGFSIGQGVLKQDWHCAKITTHASLQSAQEQVRAYQAKVATIHGIGVEK